MTSTSDEAFRKHIASFNDMATAEEWKRRYEAHDSLVKALEFYARERAYRGANQKNDGTDPFTPDDAAYIRDVTRDGGEVARTALSQAKGGK